MSMSGSGMRPPEEGRVSVICELLIGGYCQDVEDAESEPWNDVRCD